MKKPGSGTKRSQLLWTRSGCLRSGLQIGHIHHGRNIRTVKSLQRNWFHWLIRRIKDRSPELWNRSTKRDNRLKLPERLIRQADCG